MVIGNTKSELNVGKSEGQDNKKSSENENRANKEWCSQFPCFSIKALIQHGNSILYPMNKYFTKIINIEGIYFFIISLGYIFCMGFILYY